ncbi:protein NEDD1 [Gossypium australe]|uniref:Protein NEDD1 n=1 Tax=Gossypium australe TaxID=47621 RepID=A0A5B6WKV2_9ROSI|nr:protein NEDD1 [Gossypium australe]
MNLPDPSSELLAASGGDTVKIFDIKLEPNDPCVLSYSPSPSCIVNSIIASVGLDKKLYTYDSGSRRPSAFISYEAPFSSLAIKDDGWTLAAGTGNGRVVFYDIRGKLQPFTVLRAYSSSEAVSSLCWQRSKPAIVNESTCTAETALLGGAMEDSVLMPDPLPSVTSASLPSSTAVSGSRITGRSGPAEVSSLTSSSGSTSSTLNLSSSLETPIRSHLWPGGTLTRLHAPRSTFNFKDDMEVFSPLVDVHPITPSLDKLWDGHDGAKKEHLPNDKKPSSLLFPSSRRFAFADNGAGDQPILDWKSSSMSQQIIASVGLDKKLYTYDSGSRRPSAFISYEAPFSSLAIKDDGWTPAAGTGNGRVVFYDIRGKLQPFTVLRAYSSSEAASSLCWQRSKPAIVNESTCTAETTLLGGAMEDSVLMPDPLPSVTSTSLSSSTAVSGSRITGRSGPAEVSSLTSSSGSTSSTLNLSSSLETPIRSHLWPGGILTRLHAPRSTINFKDDMEVFSPLVDVHPITPSLDKLWDGHDGEKKEHLPNDKKPSSLLFPSSRRFAFADDGASDHHYLIGSPVRLNSEVQAVV